MMNPLHEYFIKCKLLHFLPTHRNECYSFWSYACFLRLGFAHIKNGTEKKGRDDDDTKERKKEGTEERRNENEKKKH